MDETHGLMAEDGRKSGEMKENLRKEERIETSGHSHRSHSAVGGGGGGGVATAGWVVQDGLYTILCWSEGGRGRKY